MKKLLFLLLFIGSFEPMLGMKAANQVMRLRPYSKQIFKDHDGMFVDANGVLVEDALDPLGDLLQPNLYCSEKDLACLPAKEQLNLKLCKVARLGLHGSIIDHWLQLGADVNDCNEGIGASMPPLFYVLSENTNPSDTHYENRKLLCLKLINAGANVNAQCSQYGHTPLMRAARLHPCLVESLITHGADVDTTDTQGHTPLWHACLIENPDKRFKICELLLNGGADVQTATLKQCMVDNDTETAKLLINKLKLINNKKNRKSVRGQWLLQMPHCDFKIDIPCLLLNAKAPIDATDPITQRTALIKAAKRHHQKLCQMIVKHQQQKNPNHLDDLLNKTDKWRGKRAFDYFQIDCLNPNKVQGLKPELIRNAELLEDLIQNDPSCRKCPTPGCSNAFELQEPSLWGQFSSLIVDQSFKCSACKNATLSLDPIKPSDPAPLHGVKAFVPAPALNTSLDLLFEPSKLPGFFHMKSDTQYRYVSCGLAAVFTMARLEAEIFGRNFDENEFKQIQEEVIPDYKDYKLVPGTRETPYTTTNEQMNLSKRLGLKHTYKLKVDDDKIQMISSPYSDAREENFSQELLDKKINDLIEKFRQSNGSFVVHFLCRVPGHVFAISIARNKHNELGMYLHDGLDHHAYHVDDMSRYIDFLYSRFF